VLPPANHQRRTAPYDLGCCSRSLFVEQTSIHSIAGKRSSRKPRGVRGRLPFSDNRRLPRPTRCIEPGARLNFGHGRRGPSAGTLVVGGGPRTGASERGSSATSPNGADRAKVGTPLRELREIRSGGGANPKGACGEQYERLCLSRGHGSG
jgi:hypothetical protein